MIEIVKSLPDFASMWGTNPADFPNEYTRERLYDKEQGGPSGVYRRAAQRWLELWDEFRGFAPVDALALPVRNLLSEANSAWRKYGMGEATIWYHCPRWSPSRPVMALSFLEARVFDSLLKRMVPMRADSQGAQTWLVSPRSALIAWQTGQINSGIAVPTDVLDGQIQGSVRRKNTELLTQAREDIASGNGLVNEDAVRFVDDGTVSPTDAETALEALAD